MIRETPKTHRLPWRNAVAPYETPVLWRSVCQVVNSVGSYLVVWYLAYRSLEVSYGLTLALAVVAAGFLARCFIILHDCGHGAFFKSQKADDFWGTIIGFLTFTPYHKWRYDHAVHHASCGDLDRRSVGDIWTLTVEEYRKSPAWKRLGYRLYRNPFVLFIPLPLLLFVVGHRLTWGVTTARERRSVHQTNLALAVIVVLAGMTIGIKAYILVQLPIMVAASSVGVWLFYVQHQFESVYWERHEKWDYVRAALEGCSFYKLPRLLQWFTGSIGFHHVHHLGPRIPNYHLEKCCRENAIFSTVEPITLVSSLKTSRLRLWDEEQRKLVGFPS